MTSLPLTFDAAGLVPVVVQDDTTDQVLMMAFMNREALELTRSTGEVHFWSRSRAALWHKGELSGHIQKVRSIHVNCNQDSLLVRVEQIGACCHTGHASCYFRQLTDVGELITRGEPLFDPDAIYGAPPLREQAMRWCGAYAWLAAHDLSDVSGTSRLLHTSTVAYLAGRVADELGEVRGVLEGSHHHVGPSEDILLEGSQVLYWIALTAIRAGVDQAEFAADVSRGGAAVGDDPIGEIVQRLDALQKRWNKLEPNTLEQLVDDTLPVLALGASNLDTSLQAMIERDLADLESKTYLIPYFAV
jgi:phosphoribosyl-AMP cyclohydrolase